MRPLSIDWSEPGAPLSAAAHVGLLVAIVVGFAASPKLPDTTESIAIETITDAQFNQIMKGEKTAKAMAKPQLRVDKVAPVELRKPAPPTPEAKLDVPSAPSSTAGIEPGNDTMVEEAPPPAAAAVPSPPMKPAMPPKLVPPPADAAKPVQAPPRAPDAKVEPTPEKPDAEVIEKAKPPKPAKDATSATDSKETKLTEQASAPAAKPETKPKPDAKPKDLVVAKLEDEKPQVVADEPKPKKIVKKKKRRAKLKPVRAPEDVLTGDQEFLARSAAQSTPSTGSTISEVAALGAPTASAQQLSPFFMGQLSELIISQYVKCWKHTNFDDTDYIPRFNVRFNPDWSLAADPTLINKPGNAKDNALADTAINAFKDSRCNPITIPASYSKYYDQWKNMILRFKQKDDDKTG